MEIISRNGKSVKSVTPLSLFPSGKAQPANHVQKIKMYCVTSISYSNLAISLWTEKVFWSTPAKIGTVYLPQTKRPDWVSAALILVLRILFPIQQTQKSLNPVEKGVLGVCGQWRKVWDLQKPSVYKGGPVSKYEFLSWCMNILPLTLFFPCLILPAFLIHLGPRNRRCPHTHLTNSGESSGTGGRTGVGPALGGLFPTTARPLPASQLQPPSTPLPNHQSQGDQTFTWLGSQLPSQPCDVYRQHGISSEHTLPKVSLEQYLFLFPFPALTEIAQKRKIETKNLHLSQILFHQENQQ